MFWQLHHEIETEEESDNSCQADEFDGEEFQRERGELEDKVHRWQSGISSEEEPRKGIPALKKTQGFI